MKQLLIVSALTFLALQAPKSALADLSGLAQPAIANGREVREGEAVAAHTVMMELSGHLCSGTLIARDMVITAAHCFTSEPDIADLYVDFGPRRPRAQRKITAYAVHQDFRSSIMDSPKGARDIALVQFSGGLPDGFSPVPMVSDSSRLRRGQPVLIAGFGLASPRDSESLALLRVASSTVLRQFNSTEILIGGSKGVSCNGDSGGPSILSVNGKLQLLGVISRSDKGCRIDEVHTRVDAYKGWIQETLRAIRER